MIFKAQLQMITKYKSSKDSKERLLFLILPYCINLVYFHFLLHHSYSHLPLSKLIFLLLLFSPSDPSYSWVLSCVLIIIGVTISSLDCFGLISIFLIESQFHYSTSFGCVCQLVSYIVVVSALTCVVRFLLLLFSASCCFIILVLIIKWWCITFFGYFFCNFFWLQWCSFIWYYTSLVIVSIIWWFIIVWVFASFSFRACRCILLYCFLMLVFDLVSIFCCGCWN